MKSVGLTKPMSNNGDITGAYGSAGYVAGFGIHEPPQESLDDQRARLQQRSGKFDHQGGGGEDDDVGEMDWTITYSDMVTLLMIFFVVLSFLSMIAQKEHKELNDGAAEVQPIPQISPFDGRGFSLVIGGNPSNVDDVQSEYDDPEAQGGTTDPAPSGEEQTGQAAQPTPPQPDSAQQNAQQNPQSNAQSNALAQKLNQMVQQNNLAGQVDVISDAQSVIVRISDKILFASGKANLEQSGSDLVARLSKVLNESGGTISIEGHTDNIPISTAVYPSNWELSAARAAMVLRQLVSLGLPASKLRAIAYADTKPVTANDTPEHRASNRRVELVISSEAKN